MEINIDATNALAGRIGTYAAKQALLGNTVNILNAEKAVISGSPEKVLERYHVRVTEIGTPQRGPFYCRLPDRFLRRLIRGMTGYKTPRGREAYKKIMCYIGVPEKFKDKKLVAIAKTSTELPTYKYQTIGKLCKALGGKA